MGGVLTFAAMSFILFAWLWLFTGLLTGVGLGLFFAREDWLGGYSSWPRRMIRLGHISFLGTGFLLLASQLTFAASGAPELASWGLLLGACSMPTVCFLSAWKKPLRHLFFIPVSGLVLGALGVIGGLIK